MSDCGCEPSHPLKPFIPPGLDQLPRHVNGFPQYRRAMLADVRCHDALREWRAREGEDLGVMLVEMWSYVLDGLGFYDERIANESYIRTAQLRPNVRKLADLVGFRPQPALRSEAILAVEVEEEQLEPVLIQEGAGFRSQAFEDESAQVFETEGRFTVQAKTNSWTIPAFRDKTVDGNIKGAQLELPVGARVGYAAKESIALPLSEILLDPLTAALTNERIAIFRWPVKGSDGKRIDEVSALDNYDLVNTPDGDIVPSAPYSIKLPNPIDEFDRYHSTGVVRRVESTVGPDDETYISVKTTALGEIARHILLSDVEILSPTLSVGLTGFYPFRLDPILTTPPGSPPPPPFYLGGIDKVQNANQTFMYLDAIYPNIRVGDLLIVEREGTMYPVYVKEAQVRPVYARRYIGPEENKTEIPVSYVEVEPALPDRFHENSATSTAPPKPDLAKRAKIRIHHNMIDGGDLVNVGKLFVKENDFEGGVPVETEQDPLPRIDDYPSEVILEDADGRAQLVCADFQKEPSTGKILFSPKCGDQLDVLKHAMRTPIKIYGNLIHVTRGESVNEEVLGSGDPTEANQSFKLQHNPITYRVNPDNSERPLNYLTVRVDKVVWEERHSFFGTGPDDRIYIVRQDDEGEFSVIFGDGIRGKRPESGVNNITCNYRHGAGGAVPPAKTIDALAFPIDGIKGVINPLPAFGGRDAQNRDEIRTAAGESVLSLDRTISLPDFEADARRYKDIINVRAGWDWNRVVGRAMVQLWYISNTTDELEPYVKGLERWLYDGAPDNIEVVAKQALPIALTLKIELEVEKGFPVEEVRQAVFDHLAHSETGVLSPANVSIGGLIFHSQLLGQIVEVPGVKAIKGYDSELKHGRIYIPPDMKIDDYRVKMPRGFYPTFEVTIDAKFSAQVDPQEFHRAEQVMQNEEARMSQIAPNYGSKFDIEVCGPIAYSAGGPTRALEPCPVRSQPSGPNPNPPAPVVDGTSCGGPA